MDARTRPRGSDSPATPPPGAAGPPPADAGVELAAREMLHRPAGTRLRVLLLIAMVALSAAFVGNWMFLSVSDSVVPSWPWLGLPPIAVLATAAILTWLAPAWLERRRGWVPVPPERGAAALARVDALAGEAGLRETPRLMWNPSEDRTRALAYGRPGDHRLAVSPVLLGAARRRPAAFDPVVRHELAHIRHRDVAPAYFAIVVWYVLLAALALPLLWRVVDRDLSLVPEYLVRGALLALVVAWVRADLLRTREGYADLRASLGTEHRRDLLASLEVPAPPHPPRRRWRAFPLHPTPAARAAVVRDPARLGRLDLGELFAVGLTAGWSIPLLAEGLTRLGLAPLHAEQVTRLAVFALVGAYVAAAMLRWAGTAQSRPGPLPPLALALGLALGPTVSIGATGLLAHSTGELLAAALTAALVAAYAVWIGDLAGVVSGGGRQWSRTRGLLVIAVGATVLACVAATMLLIADTVLNAARVVIDAPIGALETDTASLVLGLTAPAVSLAVLAVHARRQALEAILTGVLLGAAATVVLMGMTSRLDLPDDPAKVRYYLATVLVAGGAAVLAATLLASGREPGGLLAAQVAAWVAALGAATGWVAVEDLVFGANLGTMDARELLRAAWPAGAVLIAVPAAAVWLLPRGASGRSHRLARTLTGVATAVVAGAVVVALVPPVVDGPATDEIAELRAYVDTEVPVLLQRRDAAYLQVQQATMLDPQLVPGALDAVLAQYDTLLSDVVETRLDHPRAREVQTGLRSWIAAERDLVQTQRDWVLGTAGDDDLAAANEWANLTASAWTVTYERALADLGAPG